MTINDGHDEVADMIDDRSDSELTVSSELDEIELLDLKAERQEKKRMLESKKGRKGKARNGRKQNEREPMWFCNHAEKDRKRRHEDDDDPSDDGRGFSVPNNASRKLLA